MRFVGQGVTYPAPTFAIVMGDGEDLGAALEDSMARRDDAYWLRYVRQRFAWQRFTDWWLARRWIVPRDIRKR